MKDILYALIISMTIAIVYMTLNEKIVENQRQLESFKAMQSIKNEKYDENNSYLRSKYYELDNRLLQLERAR